MGWLCNREVGTMPKTRLDKYSKDPYAPLTALIYAKLAGDKQVGIRMAKAIGCSSQTTGLSRLRHPETMTLGELRLLAKNMGITNDELRGLIP